MARTKLLKSAGRFGVRYGRSVKRKIADIELKQKRKQYCIFCSGKAKRLSKGIWLCKKCGKKFTGHAYYLGTAAENPADAKEKPLKQSKTNKTKKE